MPPALAQGAGARAYKQNKPPPAPARPPPTPDPLLDLDHMPPSPPSLQHEIVPVQLVDAIAGLRHGSTMRCVRTLAKAKLVHHDNSR